MNRIDPNGGVEIQPVAIEVAPVNLILNQHSEYSVNGACMWSTSGSGIPAGAVGDLAANCHREGSRSQKDRRSQRHKDAEIEVNLIETIIV